MKKLSIIGLPIRLQIASLLVVTQILAHLLTFGVINLSLSGAQDRHTEFAKTLVEPLIVALRLASPDEARESQVMFAKLAAADSRFSLLTSPPRATSGSRDFVDPVLEHAFRSLLPSNWKDSVAISSTGSSSWRWPGSPGIDFVALVRVADGVWLSYAAGQNLLLRTVPLIVLVPGVLLLALPLMLLSIWAGSSLVAPITALALGSERFAADIECPPIPETGPEEVRRASAAFNAMRIRIQKLINSRSQTLASIGHDMRTPLTRLRLRLEALDLGESASAAEKDIRILERMIDDALIFLRSEQHPLTLGAMDVAVLTQTIADDFTDQGHRVRYDGPLHFRLICDHDHVRRVLENIIGNAVKYADDTLVRLTSDDDGSVTICVADTGPGIAPEHREHVLEPFSRIESVRAGGPSAGSSFGLGLAIARDLVTRHGGFLRLEQNLPEGLLVTIHLPGHPE